MHVYIIVPGSESTEPIEPMLLFTKISEDFSFSYCMHAQINQLNTVK